MLSFQGSFLFEELQQRLNIHGAVQFLCAVVGTVASYTQSA